MSSLSPKWREFFQHLGPYIIVIGVLALINLATSDYPWVIWPALVWGVGLAIHLWVTVVETTVAKKNKWRDFLQHLGPYIIVIGALSLINLATSDYPWAIWPAMAWGAGLAIHLWTVLFESGKESDKQPKQARSQAAADRQAAVKPEETGTKETLANAGIQTHLEWAYAYKQQIKVLIQTAPERSTQLRLQDLAAQLDEWIAAIEDLAKQVDSFQQNSLIHQDLKAVPQAIKTLETRLNEETDGATRAELEQTLANRRNQLAHLERLQSLMKRAEIKIENTLSSLGTIYSQILMSQSGNQVADYSRLSAQVDEERLTLQDHLEALEEVKLSDSA